MSAKTAVLAIVILGILGILGLGGLALSGEQAPAPQAGGQGTEVQGAPQPPNAQTGGNPSASIQAFLKASDVFLSPRCVNCHPSGDRPLQGDDSHPHAMHVVRGPEGNGKNGLLCSTCHQDRNLPGAHLPPGGIGWQLPPEDMPMVFQGVSPRVICEHLKDPAQNGNRSPDEVLDHVTTTPIVLWGWNPGEGRIPVAMPHDEFVKYVKEWIDNGAACPE